MTVSPSRWNVQSPGTNRVLDVGCGDSPDNRATDAADIRDTDAADKRFDAGTERWTYPDSSVDGVVMNHVLEHFTREEVEHAFREAGRVLRSGGWLEVTVPLGANYRTDLDHQRPWTWETPETLSEDHRRGWDPDVPFTLSDREVHAWGVRPFGVLSVPFRAAYRVLGGGLWSTEVASAPLMAGELTAVFTRVTDEVEP